MDMCDYTFCHWSDWPTPIFSNRPVSNNDSCTNNRPIDIPSHHGFFWNCQSNIRGTSHTKSDAHHRRNFFLHWDQKHNGAIHMRFMEKSCFLFNRGLSILLVDWVPGDTWYQDRHEFFDHEQNDQMGRQWTKKEHFTSASTRRNRKAVTNESYTPSSESQKIYGDSGEAILSLHGCSGLEACVGQFFAWVWSHVSNPSFFTQLQSLAETNLFDFFLHTAAQGWEQRFVVAHWEERYRKGGRLVRRLG